MPINKYIPINGKCVVVTPVTTKENENLSFSTKCIELGDFVRNEIRQTQKDRQSLNILSHMWELTKVDLNVERRLVHKERLSHQFMGCMVCVCVKISPRPLFMCNLYKPVGCAFVLTQFKINDSQCVFCN